MSTTVGLVRANERYARLRGAVEGLAAEYASRSVPGQWSSAIHPRTAADDLRALLAAVDS